MTLRFVLLPLVALAICTLKTNLSPAFADNTVSPRIAWYGTMKSGLAEAKRNGRPILLVSGAPQCLGVSGIW